VTFSQVFGETELEVEFKCRKHCEVNKDTMVGIAMDLMHVISKHVYRPSSSSESGADTHHSSHVPVPRARRGSPGDGLAPRPPEPHQSLVFYTSHLVV